jgi:ABC-type transport system involved in multi-copper enzyme maturation permease subunit
MSTAAAPLPARTPRAAHRGRDTRPGLARLTRVELRKATDTRAGFWLLLGIVGITALTVLLTVATGPAESHTFANVLENALQPLAIMLPIVGILLITSEWSQRTALLTFTLVPQRGRVLVAKILASLVLAVAAVAAALVLSALATAINPAPADAWHLDLGLLALSTLYTMISMLIGVGLGAALLLSAPAIVAVFVLPLAWTAITHLIPGLEGLARWTDQSETFSGLTDHTLSGHEWAQVLTTTLLWAALPLAIGTWRFLRGEIR